jgi:hypothetical protein
MRGTWLDDQTFVVEWMPMPGNNGGTEIRTTFDGDRIELSLQPVIFGGEPVVIQGSSNPPY